MRSRRKEPLMEPTYPPPYFTTAAKAALRAMIFIAQAFGLALAHVIPTIVIVLPYCWVMASKMPPANSFGTGALAMAALLLGAGLMAGTLWMTYRLYGRRLMTRLGL